MKLKPILLAVVLLAGTNAFAQNAAGQGNVTQIDLEQDEEQDVNTQSKLGTVLKKMSEQLHKVKPYDKDASRKGAILYALPKLNIYVEITANCTYNIPGPFAQYAERYLASSDAIMHRSRTWSFQKAEIVDEVAIDSSKMYLVEKERNRVVYNLNQPIIRAVGDWVLTVPRIVQTRRFCTVDSVFHTEFLGEEALSSTSIPKMAERAAKQITQLREARMAILSCDVAHQPDGIATREILHRLDSVERELTALFVGKRVTITAKRRFAIDPTKKQTNLIIARLSTLEGIKDADEMIGVPIYVDINPLILTAPETPKKEKKMKKGYFYNVPGGVTIDVRQGADYNLTKSMYVPQNGYATWLKRDVMHILFTRIGSIQMIK